MGDGVHKTVKRDLRWSGSRTDIAHYRQQYYENTNFTFICAVSLLIQEIQTGKKKLIQAVTLRYFLPIQTEESKVLTTHTHKEVAMWGDTSIN